MTPLLTNPADAEPRFAWTPQDAAAAAAVLAEVSDEVREVIVLTDEEVVALDGLQHAQLVPTPWLDAQEISRDQLGGIALRGLIARAMVALGPKAGPDGQPTGELDLVANTAITGTLVLRRTAQRLVRVEKRSNAGVRWLFAYVHDDGVLIEDIDPNGLHGFGVTTPAGAAAFLRAATNDYDAAGTATDTLTYSTPEFEALTDEPAPFAGAETAAVFGGYRFGSESAQAGVIYAGPERVGLLVDHEGTFRARGITDADLHALFAGLIAGDADEVLQR